MLGTSLEAAVTVTADGELARLLETYRDDLPMLFITSAVTLETGSDDGATAGAVSSETAGSARIEVKPRGGGQVPALLALGAAHVGGPGRSRDRGLRPLRGRAVGNGHPGRLT